MNRKLVTCPVCNGTKRVPAGDTKFKTVLASYDAETDTLACHNCGGRSMYGQATGLTYERDDGTPCIHEYEVYRQSMSYTVYKCKHCGTGYDIDSGD